MGKKEVLEQEAKLLRKRLAEIDNALEAVQKGNNSQLLSIEPEAVSPDVASNKCDTDELARLIVHNSPVVLFRREAGEKATLVYVSENVEQWGYTAESLLSEEIRFKDLLVTDDEDDFIEEIKGYREEGVDSYLMEYRIKTREGKIRWVSDETSVIRAEDGTPLYNQGIVVDITSRKEAELALRQSEQKFRRTIEGAGEGYLLLDKNLHILEVNEAYCRMLGYSAEELLGKQPQDFATDEYRNFLRHNSEALLGQPYRRFEGTMIAKDGHIVPILVNANTLTCESGELIGHVAFVADITEQKKALVLAEEVHRSLLPTQSPKMPGFDIAGVSIPSESVGGDYFDYLTDVGASSGSMLVAVGDISGHGVDAALLMTTARGFLRMRSAQGGELSQIVSDMNRHLASDLFGTGRFMTLLLVGLAPESNAIRWVRAGHDPAILYCSKTDSFHEASGGGLALGVLSDVGFEDQGGELLPGQLMALGTDGIWETAKPDGEMFGKARFREMLRKHAKLSAQEIVDKVFEAVLAFAGGGRPNDDLTLVIIKNTTETE